MGILSGYRVIDLTIAMAGPWPRCAWGTWART